MAQFRITAPDGAVYDVTAPEGATEQDALAQVQAQHQQALPIQPPHPPPVADFSQFKNARGPVTTQSVNIGPTGPEAPGMAGRQADYLKGTVEGFPANAAGVIGDTEGLGRQILSKVGVPVSEQPIAPTSETVGNALFGQAATPEQAAGRRGIGTLTGPALLGKGLGTVVSGYARVTAPLTRQIVGALNKAKESLTGTPFRDPQTYAERILRGDIQSEGGAAPIIRSLNSWGESGASNPALIDVSGNTVRRRVRAAASGSTGNAQNVAQTYAERVAGNLQDRASGLANELTPNETRPANAVQQELTTTRDALAQRNYRGPYSDPAAVTPEMVSALQGPAGNRAINAAYITASDARDAQQMAELSDLRDVAREQSGGADPITGRRRSLAQALSEVSAGSLDRVRIAMRDRGIALNSGPNRQGARAAAHFDRVSDIDTALDQTPGLQEARGQYRGYSERIRGIDLGQTAINTPSSEYASQVGRLATPGGQEAVGVGHRQAIIDAIQRPAEGSTGALNRLSTSEQQRQNLTTSFGPDVASRFQAGISNEARRLQNARFISPNTGSQTALRTADASLVESLPIEGKVGLIKTIWNTIRQGDILSDAEREAIVRLGTSEADLRRIIAQSPNSNPEQIARRILLVPGPGSVDQSSRHQ